MKSRALFLLAALACLPLVGPLCPSKVSYRAGVAVVDITPDVPIYLAGYGARLDPATAVLDPLSVRALALADDEGGRLVLVSADVCGFDPGFAGDIRAEVQASRGLAPEQVMIVATHTHAAPVVQHWTVWDPVMQEPDPAYMALFRASVIAAIQEAVDTMESAELTFGRGTSEIGYNRRTGDEPYDRTLDVLKVQADDGGGLAVVFFHGCHPVSLGGIFSVSAEYPGAARDRIEELVGDGAVGIFIQGFGGDINPRAPEGKYTPEQMVQIGENLADDVVAVLSGTMEELDGELEAALAVIDVPMQDPPSEQEVLDLREQYEGQGGVSAQMMVRWCDLMLEYIAHGTMPDSLPTPVQVFSAGDSWRLAGVSREVVTEYGDGVRALWPDRHVTVAGYANEVASYLPNAWHISGHHYEGYSSFFWYAQPAPPTLDVYQNVLDGIADAF